MCIHYSTMNLLASCKVCLCFYCCVGINTIRYDFIFMKIGFLSMIIYIMVFKVCCICSTRQFYNECINEWYHLYHCGLSYNDCSIRVYRSFNYNFLQMLNIAINSCFTHLYYTDSILNVFNDPLCLKLC